MPIGLTSQERATLRRLWTLFSNDFHNEFVDRIQRVSRVELPHTLQSFWNQLVALNSALSQGPNVDDPVELEEGLGPALKLVILTERRKLALDIERRKQGVVHFELAEMLDDQLDNQFKSLMQQSWIHRTEALATPRLSDFLTLEVTTAILEADGLKLQPRQYDEKFHVLQAPSLAVADLQYYRETSALRGRSVTVAFMDIDDFKIFNSQYSETVVDRKVLPVFMRCVEGFAYGRGHAYRFGGDEYVVLLLGVAPHTAGLVLDELRKDVEHLRYMGIDRTTTVSIGFCEIRPDCFLTDHEALERANIAKQFAKKNGGKNCLATYKHELFRDEDRHVWRSPS